MKKLFYGLGAIAAVATPVVAVVSCGSKSEENLSGLSGLIVSHISTTEPTKETDALEFHINLSEEQTKDVLVEAGLLAENEKTDDAKFFAAITEADQSDKYIDKLQKDLNIYLHDGQHMKPLSFQTADEFKNTTIDMAFETGKRPDGSDSAHDNFLRITITLYPRLSQDDSEDVQTALDEYHNPSRAAIKNEIIAEFTKLFKFIDNKTLSVKK